MRKAVITAVMLVVPLLAGLLFALPGSASVTALENFDARSQVELTNGTLFGGLNGFNQAGILTLSSARGGKELKAQPQEPDPEKIPINFLLECTSPALGVMLCGRQGFVSLRAENPTGFAAAVSVQLEQIDKQTIAIPCGSYLLTDLSGNSVTADCQVSAPFYVTTLYNGAYVILPSGFKGYIYLPLQEESFTFYNKDSNHALETTTGSLADTDQLRLAYLFTTWETYCLLDDISVVSALPTQTAAPAATGTAAPTAVATSANPTTAITPGGTSTPAVSATQIHPGTPAPPTPASTAMQTPAVTQGVTATPAVSFIPGTASPQTPAPTNTGAGSETAPLYSVTPGLSTQAPSAAPADTAPPQNSINTLQPGQTAAVVTATEPLIIPAAVNSLLPYALVSAALAGVAGITALALHIKIKSKKNRGTVRAPAIR